MKQAFERIKQFFVDLPWRRMYRISSVVVFVTTVIGAIAFSAYRSYNIGHKEGLRTGQCQVGCALMDMEYSFHDEEGSCWCANGPGSYFQIPVRKEF